MKKKSSANLNFPPTNTVKYENPAEIEANDLPVDVDGLEASIEEQGQQSPITLDSNGKLIHGRRRLAVAKKNGWGISVQRLPYSGTQAEIAAIHARLVRGERTVLLEAEDFLVWKTYYEQQHPDAKVGGKKTKGKQNPSLGFCKYAEKLTGRSSSSIAALIQVAGIPADDRLQIKAYSNITDNQEKLLALAQFDETDEENEGVTRQEVAAVWSHHPKWNIAKCQQEAIYQKIKEATPELLNWDHQNYPIVEGDFYKAMMQMEPESVDAVISDIPWDKEFLSRLENLTAAIVHVLKPGAPVILMYGQQYWNRLMLALEKSGLEYHWLLADDQGDGLELKNYQRHIYNHWKPLLIYSKGEFQHSYVRDLFRSAGMKNKKFFKHQQAIQLFEWVVEKFTKPGDSVVEPFLGSGTTMLACMNKGRRCIGIDINTTTAKYRLSKENKEKTK